MKKIKNKKLIVGIVAIVIFIAIVSTVIIHNINMNNQLKEIEYLQGENANSSLIANNIKKGITIGGITGRFEVLDTSDANAKPEDISEGKTAYVNGVKITGTMRPKVEGVTIPKGFYYVGGTKATGIVISDNQSDENKGTSHDSAAKMEGNQFVWIPVENESLFRSYDGYYDGNLHDGIVDNCSETSENGYTNEEKEFNEMKASVIANKGFYVGRYESGTTNPSRNENSGITDKVLIQQGKNVYNYVGWNNSETNAMNDETEGAVELAKGFTRANGYTSVTSTLIYGVQWDSIMNFIDPKYATENCDANSFVRDSSGKGWYDQDEPTVTGSNEIYSVKNIYDLGGNVAEWTMEVSYNIYRVIRGGHFGNSGLPNPASSRGGNYPSDNNVYIGFRVALYL